MPASLPSSSVAPATVKGVMREVAFWSGRVGGGSGMAGESTEVVVPRNPRGATNTTL